MSSSDLEAGLLCVLPMLPPLVKGSLWPSSPTADLVDLQALLQCRQLLLQASLTAALPQHLYSQPGSDIGLQGLPPEVGQRVTHSHHDSAHPCGHQGGRAGGIPMTVSCSRKKGS